MTIVIHHNPSCGTSRNTLDMIRASGEEPIIVDYLQTGWTRPQLRALFAVASLTPKTALREARSPAKELGLLKKGVTDETILDAMLEHPVLVNRPLVCSPKGVRLCRPSELVLGLLDSSTEGQFTKEDGEIIGKDK